MMRKTPDWHSDDRIAKLEDLLWEVRLVGDKDVIKQAELLVGYIFSFFMSDEDNTIRSDGKMTTTFDATSFQIGQLRAAMRAELDTNR
ncbi:MAG: hypothetical protein U1E40_15810 [Amaricoccus sp.]